MFSLEVVADLKASYRVLNWLTEVDSVTRAGKAFHALTTLLVKKLARCWHFVMTWLESLLLCPLTPPAGPA